MCGPGPQSLKSGDEEYIPVTFNVTAEEYLLLLKKKNGKTWRELFLPDKGEKKL